MKYENFYFHYYSLLCQPYVALIFLFYFLSLFLLDLSHFHMYPITQNTNIQFYNFINILLQYVICQIITKHQLGNFLTLKTIGWDNVSPIFNSNWLMCCITCCGDVGWCYWCAVWWYVHILFNERTLGQDFKIYIVMWISLDF